MRNFAIAGAGLALSLSIMAGLPTAAGVAAAAAQTPSFVPDDFSPPIRVETPDFVLVPLGPEVVDIDYAAYMSSIEHLQTTFTRSTGWPHQNISADDAMRDMETERERFENRQSFAYAVLTPDGSRERGSVYVAPSPVAAHDAVVRLWVTKAEYDAGFDAELYEWVTEWVAAEWPFHSVAYPGRAIDWHNWDAMVAATTAQSGG